jgi:hypothetical protein
LLGRGELRLGAHQVVLGVRDRMPGGGEPGVVSCGLERRQSCLSEGAEPAVVGCGRVEREHVAPLLEPREQLASMVACGCRPFGRRPRDHLGVRDSARAEEGVGQVEIELDAAPFGRKQGDRALEQVDLSEEVVAEQRAAACSRQQVSGPGGERRCLGADEAELRAVAVRLLEVVTHDLVGFDEVGRVWQQPAGEALVQLGSHRFRQRDVGGVANEQMAEPEPVVSRELRSVGPDELLANECRQSCRHALLAGLEGLHRPAVEDLTLDRAPLEHAALLGLELLDPGGKQRLDRRRHDDLRIRRATEHRTISSTKSGFPPAARRIRSRRSSSIV